MQWRAFLPLAFSKIFFFKNLFITLVKVSLNICVLLLNLSFVGLTEFYLNPTIINHEHIESFVKILTAISNCGPLVTLSNVQGTFCQNIIRVAFQKIKKSLGGHVLSPFDIK